MTEAVATIKGRKLDARYTLLDKLGAGGQGEVWRAHDATRGIDIALKVLNPTAHQAEAWSALEHEYAIASRLDHPSILKVFPPERSGDAMVLPMELASGGDLRRLRGAGFLEIIPVLLEIAQALEHAHERGVVHRDLKPGNVLFDARGRARLADFGVAETSMTATEAKTSTPATVATRDTNKHGFSPFTASPAQLRGEPPTPADDIYGLGALAYELLSGYPPYYPHFDKKRAIEERVPTLVPTRQIPPLLGALVMHMLAKDPKRRPRTMREVIDELDAALNDTLTFDFENVSSSTPTTSISAASSHAQSTRASPEAGQSQASPTNTSDSAAEQVVWTPTSQDRRATPDRRGRRKEDLTPPSQREPTISSDLSDIGATGTDPRLAADHAPGARGSATADSRASGGISAGETAARASHGADADMRANEKPDAYTPATPGPNSGDRAPATPGPSSGDRASTSAGPNFGDRTSTSADANSGDRSRAAPGPNFGDRTPARLGSYAGFSGAASAASKPEADSGSPAGSSSPTSAGPDLDATAVMPVLSDGPDTGASATRPPPRSGSDALARIDAALARAAAQPKPTPLTPAEAAAIVAAARAAASKSPSSIATNQPAVSHPPFASPASAPSAPSKPKWPRGGNSTPASPADEASAMTAPISPPDPGKTVPLQSFLAGTSAEAPAASRTASESTLWRSPPGQPTTTHWAPEPTPHWLPSHATPSNAPAAGPAASTQHSGGRAPSARPQAAQPTPGHGPSAQQPAGYGPPAQASPWHATPGQPTPGHGPSAQQPAGYGSPGQPTPWHATPGQPTPGHAASAQPTPGHAPYGAQPTPGHAAPPAHSAGMQPTASAHPANVPFGTRAIPAPIHAGPMHANWGEIPLDGLPKVARLQPIRPARWPWVFLGLLAGGAAAVYFWLPRFDTQTLPPEVAAVVAPLKAALSPGSSSTPTAPVVPASVASGSSPEGTATAQSAIRSSGTAPAGTATPYATEAPTATAATSTSASASARAATAGDEQRLREMRQTFDTRIAALEARGAGAWGGREFATAKIRAAESVGAQDAGNPRVAQERLTVAMKLLDTVESKAPQAFSAQVAAGEKALGAGQQEVAGQAFDLARRISPTDRRAADGQRRAQNLNALLPLFADAQNAKAAHDYARAAQDYSQALFLDPGNATARAGQARANAAFGDDNYAKAVGSGFAALGAGRLDEAHDAFVKARALKPNGAEASEGLRRVGAALTARGFASMRQRAVGLEAQERWEEAQRVYEDVLAADPSLAFAQEGKARTTSRADLSNRLQQLLDRPDRLSSPGVREDARALLETARAQSPQGPVIRSQIARLEILLPGFDRPVRLSLLSDNSTQVVISSIGSFGSFARRDIELRPGKYTVVGTRYGFRDVRREITVAPGQDTQTIRVTCSDPI
jgi:serine/threonine protein kinase/tetratricopeptide (TPR) repeat protein